MRQWRLLCIWACAVSVLSACQDNRETADTKPQHAAAPACELMVGWDPWEPYQYADADGTVRGLDVEIADLLAADAQCELKYVRGEWGQLLSQLRDGEVHMLLAGTVLPEREAYAQFSDPYREEAFAVFVRGDSLEKLKSMDILQLAEAGHKVGITEGYFYGEEINEKAYTGALASAFLPAPFAELNYWRLLDGTTDALLDDPFVGVSVIRRKGWENRIVRHPQVLRSGTVSLMFSRASVAAEQVKQFNDALARRKADGSIDRIVGKYRR